MFDSLLEKVFDKAETLERFLSICEFTDFVYSEKTNFFKNEFSRRSISKPQSLEEKVFRHCTVITQLYSVYENFCEELIGFWLARLPSYKQFSDLPESFKTNYRNEIGRLVQNLSQRRYWNLNEEDVIKKYHSSISGNPEWEFVVEALIAHEQNLRKETLEHLFSRIDLKGVWSFLTKSDQLKGISHSNFSNQSIDNILMNFVDYRNEASHGHPDDILGIDELKAWIDFVLSFCISLSEFMTCTMINEEVTKNPQQVIGKVTETFKGNVCIFEATKCSISVGDKVYFHRPGSCSSGTILSIKLDDNDVSSISIVEDHLEIGIKTSVKGKKRAQIVRIANFD